MRIGKLQQRITIQSRTASLDAYGQEQNSWSTVATVWASVEPIGGKERLRTFAMDSMLTHTVTVRYSADLMPPKEAAAWRILYGSRIFNITAAMDVDSAHKQIVFECNEGPADGQ